MTTTDTRRTGLQRWWQRLPLRVRQWAWFVILWCGGLLTVLALAYPIKLVILSM